MGIDLLIASGGTRFVDSEAKATNWPSELMAGVALTPLPGTGVTLLSFETSVV